MRGEPPIQKVEYKTLRGKREKKTKDQDELRVWTLARSKKLAPKPGFPTGK